MQHHPPSPGYGLLHDVRAKPPLQLLQLYGLDACHHTYIRPAAYGFGGEGEGGFMGGGWKGVGEQGSQDTAGERGGR